MNGPARQPRFPFEPLADICANRYRQPNEPGRSQGGPVHHIYVALGERFAKSVIHNWQRNGITSTQADRAATELGYHPSMIWPNWDEAHDDA